MAKELCIVTGLSGAGKSTALRAFEDLGFFTVEGLPASLSPDMAGLMNKPAMQRFKGIAIGMDMREANFIEEFNAALLKLQPHGMGVNLVFLDASDAELMKRYASTRRPHPYEKKGLALAEALANERRDLQPLREMADLVVDSSGYSIHDLRRAIHKLFSPDQATRQTIRINVISFGFKYGLPEDADFVFDARFLDNPFFVPNLKPLSGLDPEITEFVFKSGAATEYAHLLTQLFKFVLPQMEREGRSRVTIAIGCTGGRHRSVAIAEKLAWELRQAGYGPIVEHRNIDRDMQQEKQKRDGIGPDYKYLKRQGQKNE